MSSVSNKDIALSIVNFLKQSVSNKEIAEDYAESMDVAIDCIADAFEVNKDDDAEIVKTKFGGRSLSDLINSSLNASPASAKSEESGEVSPEIKEKADQLKVEGNRAMAARNFTDAIEKYTQAIELDSKNVVYLSNRAAAYSSLSQHEKAVKDAEAAIKLNPNFSKAYSRLGLAKYALGDANGSMEAYKKGLEVEGDKKSDAMNKGYETAKRRVEEELEKSMPQKEVSESTSTESPSNNEGASRGGMPDLSSLFGGSGGMPALGDMMNNPQIMQAAQEMMSNPSAMAGLMNNPAIRQMAQNFGLGGGQGGEGGSTPDLSDLMNNPMLQNMANQFMGGNRGNDNSNN